MNERITKPIFITSLILIMFSCSENRTTRNEFGKYSLELLLSNKPANEIYVMPKDTLFTNDSILLFWMRNLKDSIKYRNYLKQQDNEIKKWQKKSIDLDLNNKQIKFLKTELDTLDDTFYGRKDLTVYFTADNEEHFFVLSDVYNLPNYWATYSIGSPTSKAEQLEKRKTTALEPYIPFGFYPTGCNWEFDKQRPKEFTKFFANFKNSSSDSFESVKFRLKIYKEDDLGKTQIFNKLIEKKVTINEDDLIRIEINELREFYLGIDITKKEKFSVDIKLIDVKPRPGYEDLPY